MISIIEYPDWGFGNRLLYYNNLRQLAEKNADSWSTVPFNGHEHFENVIQYSRGANNVLNPCLGEKFFEWHSTSTRNIFKLKEEASVPTKTVAIHFRGLDFQEWNPKAILSSEYYYKAIDQTWDDGASQYVLFTDDDSLPSYNKMIEYLSKYKLPYSLGENSKDRKHYINDFSKMCSCDYIISSPSTYNICAGFIGKHKKIIHSEEWVKERCEQDDKFWCDLYSGGNEDYSIWRLV